MDEEMSKKEKVYTIVMLVLFNISIAWLSWFVVFAEFMWWAK